jgi:hypothetical protein
MSEMEKLLMMWMGDKTQKDVPLSIMVVYGKARNSF